MQYDIRGAHPLISMAIATSKRKHEMQEKLEKTLEAGLQYIRISVVETLVLRS